MIKLSGCLLGFATLAVAVWAALPQTQSVADPPSVIKRAGHPLFMSPHVAPIAVDKGLVFVANTPADTVDVISAATSTVVRSIPVGINPVSIALRPDGKEIWVSNHVSDSVSVIDNDRNSLTYMQVVATIQEFDPHTHATLFDEPVGIAFASNKKAYVALSSSNQIAVIDVVGRKVVNRLSIPAQDPRAIAVRDGKLYVIPFESGNQTQLSGGRKPFDGKLVTFDAWQHSVFNNNVLSLGHVVDIVKNPAVPDHDLFVFDTETDKPVATIDTLGTLLYGLAVGPNGTVYIAQTDARNDVNGRAGTKKHGLKELENRPFFNRITAVSLQPSGAHQTRMIDLEPLPPLQPAPDSAFATPYGIEISRDSKIIYATASGSDLFFTLDAATGKVLSRTPVGATPDGLAVEYAGKDKAARAWVLNAADNTVSVIALGSSKQPTTKTIALYDPTDPMLKKGRALFSSARLSSTGTFSCASCHPDGHTDQLLWVLNTPIVTGGNQIMPRSTMPLRGLRDTEPYHWDGTLGDPYGGINSAHLTTPVPPNSTLQDPLSSPENLIDASLANTMRLDGDNSANEEGKLGKITKQERRDLSAFILSIPYPPAPARSYTNVLSERARNGFELFHIKGDLDPSKPSPNVCGDCHRLPFLTSTKTPGTGMDAPTWRGAYDRWLILPQGRLNIIDFDFYRAVAAKGAPENEIWRFAWGGRERFDPVWNMVLEGSTGFPGAFARQFTLNRQTSNSADIAELRAALELAAAENTVELTGSGVLMDGKRTEPLALEFKNGSYHTTGSKQQSYTADKLAKLASQGEFVGTFTARLGSQIGIATPQPAIWTYGPLQNQRGHEVFPVLYPGSLPLEFSGKHLDDGALVIVDGRCVAGTVKASGSTVTVALDKLPDIGLHFLQLQRPGGLVSNELIFTVAKDASGATQQLIDAVTYHKTERIANMLAHNASANAKGGDGNTALHVAAFFCEADVVDMLLKHGATPDVRNNNGETAIDSVASSWNPTLQSIYTYIGNLLGVPVDMDRVQKARPEIANQLRKAMAQRGISGNRKLTSLAR